MLTLAPSRSLATEQAVTYRVALLEALAAKDKALDSGKTEDWIETLELLRRADTIQTTAAGKYELAFAAAQLGHIDLAMEDYRASIELGLPDKASERARDYILRHVARVAQLQIEGPPGTVILLRGVQRGQLPLSKFVYATPGSVTIEAIFSDGRRAERTLTVAAGQIARALIEPNETASQQPNEGAAPHGQTLETDENETEPTDVHHDASPVIPKSTSTPVAGQRHPALRRAGWTLAATGATVAVLSAAFMPIAYSRVSSSRDALRDTCAEQLDIPDGCAHSKQGRWQEAQSASNAIATWKMARTVSWVGLVTGLAVTLGGSAVIMRSEPRDEHSVTAIQLSAGPQRMQISYASQF